MAERAEIEVNAVAEAADVRTPTGLARSSWITFRQGVIIVICGRAKEPPSGPILMLCIGL